MFLERVMRLVNHWKMVLCFCCNNTNLKSKNTHFLIDMQFACSIKVKNRIEGPWMSEIQFHDDFEVLIQPNLSKKYSLSIRL